MLRETIKFQAQVFKRWIGPSIKEISINWILQLVNFLLIHWIVIYAVDSAIHLLNNSGAPMGKNNADVFNKVDVLTHTKCRPIADNIFQHLTLIFNTF